LPIAVATWALRPWRGASTMLKLTPPLTVIEANLFDPSLDRLRHWSAPNVTQVPSDPVCQELLHAWNQSQTEMAEPPSAPPASPMPAHLAAKISQRLAAREQAWPLRPEPGLIVRLDRAQGPTGPLDWDMPHPLTVLLAEPTEERDLWYGWLMAWETDYAGPWDLILDERDEPYDPLAAMVQVWNPVHLYWPAASAVLGQLQPERLAAARDLALELGSAAPAAGTGRPGTLVQRTTSGGHLVLTGAPLGDTEDPRRRYRELYFAAAGLVRDMARQAIPVPAPRPWWAGVIDAFQDSVRTAGLTLSPVPVAALGPEEPPPPHSVTWQLADWITCRLIPGAKGDSLRLHIRLLQSAPLLVGLERGERVRQQSRLTAESPETDLIAGADQALTFFIRDAAGTTLYALPLPSLQAEP